MLHAWPEQVERVAAFLRAAGADARLEELGNPGATAQEAAESIGCSPRCVVKSLVLVCEGRPLLVLVPGDRRVDTSKAARAVAARRARVAEASEVVAATGYEPGSVTPLALKAIPTVLVDRLLLGEPRLWVGGGSSGHMVALQPLELVRLTRGTAADLVQETA
jgi:Cys-tRNA(Pro)/Cys-tRNA(Cys) deacylase